MKYSKVITIFLAMGLLIPGFASAREDISSKVDFSLHIFTSTNLTGNIEPCG